MKLKDELAHGVNKGLDIAVRLLEPINEQFPSISYVNFCQLDGMVADEVTGGPDVRFHPGREVSDVNEAFSYYLHPPGCSSFLFFPFFIIRSLFILLLCKFCLVRIFYTKDSCF
ncbi:hypothetical protein MKX03_026638 [Papaver bracteatum]|nr:hypothetical protein MKX03_026638 [Papaver bracteatum]